MSERMEWFQLDPVDAWFFRDGRPSNRGEDQSDLESQFPPHAATVVGALRAALARSQGWDGHRDWPAPVKQVLGDGFEDLRNLSFTGPFLKRNGQLLFPLPRHVLGRAVEEEEDAKKRKRFHSLDWLIPSGKVLSDAGEIHLPIPARRSRNGESSHGKPPAAAEAFWVTAGGLESILSGEFPNPDETWHGSDLFCLEPRVGIERGSQTRTTGEGALYNPSYVRLAKGVALAVGVAGLPVGWQLPAVFPLGGESRLARCQRVETVSMPKSSTSAGQLVLVLSTPARFSQGPWWGAGPGDTVSRLYGGLPGSVQTMATDRPLRIGGWNSLQGIPLPLASHVAAGAVWWLEAVSHLPESQPLKLGDRTAWGCGLAFLGTQPK